MGRNSVYEAEKQKIRAAIIAGSPIGFRLELMA